MKTVCHFVGNVGKYYQEGVKMKDPWIGTFTGKRFHFMNPLPGEICIEDIAHALALTCRFGGQCSTFYSVAEHSYRVALLIERQDRLAALLHDAHEAYLHDILAPIKYYIFGYRELADNIQKEINKTFQVELKYPSLLKLADEQLLATEARDLMKFTKGWDILSPPLYDKIQPTNWQLAEKVFLDFYAEYRNE